MEKRATMLVSLKAHLKGIILRELDLSIFKFLQVDDDKSNGNSNGLSLPVIKKMKLVKALRGIGLDANAIRNLCAPAVTRAFVEWLVKGNAYSTRSKVVVAIKAREGGRVKGASTGNLTFSPELAGIALYGSFTSRKEWDGTETRVQDYPGLWKSSDPAVKRAVDEKAAGEVELVCGKEGAGSLLMEYAVTRLMHLNAKRNTAILVNLAGQRNRKGAVYPLLNTVERMGFVSTPMDIVHKGTGATKSAAQVEKQETMRWFAMKGTQWRRDFVAYMSEQLKQFAPISDQSRQFLCPASTRTGISACT